MELGVLFGLGSAAAFGAGDFSGGLASRRVSGLTVAGLAQAIGLVALLILLAILRPAPPSTGAIAIAAVAGACGGIGLVALYAGLSLGSMGRGHGPVRRRLGRAAAARWATPSVAHRSRPASGSASWSPWRRWAPPAAPRGRAFRPRAVAARHHGRGLLRPLVPAARRRCRGAGSEAWALVASRGAATVLIGGAALMRGRYAGLRAAWPIVLLAGTMDVTGNAAFVLARSTLPVGVAAALSGIYPIVTMLLARAVLRRVPAPPGHRGRAAGGRSGSSSSPSAERSARASRHRSRHGVRGVASWRLVIGPSPVGMRAGRRARPGERRRALLPDYLPAAYQADEAAYHDRPPHGRHPSLRMTFDRVAIVERALDDYLAGAADAGQALEPDAPIREGSGLTARQAIELFEDQVTSRAHRRRRRAS